jgi:hypothetical protein
VAVSIYLSVPDTEWYEFFDCPRCHTKTLAEGIVVRRIITIVFVPVPLWRDWLFVCCHCKATWKINKSEWMTRKLRGLTPEQVASEERAIEGERRKQIKPELESTVQRIESEGWTFLNHSNTGLEFYRRRAQEVQRLRVTLAADGHQTRKKWVERA